jgi:hypothetical protein
MTSPAAAGERFLATGELTWMREIALTLRSALGPASRCCRLVGGERCDRTLFGARGERAVDDG